MKNLIYFLQFVFIILFFLIFKIFKLRISSAIGGKLFEVIGPIFRSKNLIFENIKKALPDLSDKEIKKINNKMWNNYGRIFAEYMFLKNLRNDLNKSNIVVDGQEILDQIKKSNTPVVFISGHFSNFELMAMQIEKFGIELAALYRPLNNYFLNPIMENIRKKYICKTQIKKGISGTKDLLLNLKKGSSIALMIDQRVSQGIRSNLFNKEALTTTIPAQFIKKYKTKIVPVYIERSKEVFFKIKFFEPVEFSTESSIETITLKLNKILESMITKNPDQWIWTHNRWK